MHSSVLLLLALALSIEAGTTSLLTDISKISRYWGQLTPYKDNPDDLFGVKYTGLPAGCQIESVQTLQRHSDRFPTSHTLDKSIEQLSRKITEFTSNQANTKFEGVLNFLNSWQNPFDGHYLTGPGAASQFTAGVDFWNQYGRILYNASSGQLAYNPRFPNGTARPPVILRTTEQSRIQNSQINWALGFFGSSRQQKPNPSFINVTQPYNVVIIPEETEKKWNNTLASYISCPNLFKKIEIRRMGSQLQNNYIQDYIGEAKERLQNLAPDGLDLSKNDAFAMQLLCAYESAFIGASSFCELFSEDEWAGFSKSFDISFYHTFNYGNPTGRAQGIGYVQEMLARLNHSLITSSSSSVNSTLSGNSATFPTNQAFYADFSHDTVIIAALAALSIEYFHSPPNVTQYPPESDSKFKLSQISPFGARLVTETIGCDSANPKPRKFPTIFYKYGQDGYEASKATHKFVRMRLNNGIVPLNTIRDGVCGDEETGRIDGMCALKDFVGNQEKITALANYQYVCFANYTINDPKSGRDFDGTIFPSTNS